MELRWTINKGWLCIPIEVCNSEDKKRNEELGIDTPLEWEWDNSFKVYLPFVTAYHQFRAREGDEIKRTTIYIGGESFVIPMDYKDLDKLMQLGGSQEI